MKKILSLLLTVAMTVSIVAGCGSSSTESTGSSSSEGSSTSEMAASDLKIGVIYIGDENEGYTASHMNGIKEMADTLGLSDDQIIEKTTIPEDESCYDAAVDLADQGCNIIFGTSFGHESYLLQAAAEYPEVQFCHATGYQAASSGLDNMHNYFDNIYEARYVSGIVAGMKIKAMIDDGTITADQAKMGYVGAFPYAEVISGFTAFYLGAKSIVPDVTMEVKYTNSWADSSLEAETATALISDGCVLISQHADTTGAPTACEEANVPCVGYNVDMTSVAPNSALTSPTNDWGVYYTYAVQSVLDGTAIDVDWSKGFSDGAVALTKLGTSCAEGSQDAVDTAIAAISDGSLHVFDTSTFTIGGKTLEDLVASDESYGEGDYATKYADKADVVSDGYYHESELVSAPSFDMIIDGITSAN